MMTWQPFSTQTRIPTCQTPSVRRRFWSLMPVLVCVLAHVSSLPGKANDTAAVEAALRSITAEDLREVATVLADDALGGREAGSDGGHVAAGYITRRLARLKLTPAGTDRSSYYQTFGADYRNVLAAIEGSDPDLRQEWIVVGAHFDHVGLGNQRNSYGPWGYVHNGADDNASGTAAVLEIAEALSRLPVAPARSILFACWDGEEKGLLGSKHWCSDPTVPLESVRFAINLDMIGRLRDRRLEVYGAHTGTDVRRCIVEQNQAHPLKLAFTWELKANSDHFPFYSHHIPVVMFHTGLHEDYHRPTDDIELLNTEGMALVTRLTCRVVMAMADAPAAPQFRESAGSEDAQLDAALAEEAGPPPPRLGITWHHEGRGPHPLVVASVSPESAAAVAGVQVGDRLIRLGAESIESDTQFRRAVDISPQQVTLVIRRNEQLREFALNLRGKPRWFGVRVRRDPANPSTRVICHITPDSPAQRAGLQLGDRLYEVNGKRMDAGEWWQVMAPDSKGTCHCVVERDGRLQDVTVREDPAK